METIKSYSEFLNEEVTTPSILTNQIEFGNPIQEHLELINSECSVKAWFISSGMAQTIIDEAPLNDSETTKQDLEALELQLQKTTPEQIAFARHVDKVENFANMFIDILKEEDPNISMGDFFSVDSQTEPILFYLKNKINRPRPYQLAKALKYSVNPIIKTDACSASYPSGHALSGYFISQYFAKKYPNLKDRLLELGEKIADSRVHVGIHFPSDSAISRKIAEIILENNLIQNETH